MFVYKYIMHVYNIYLNQCSIEKTSVTSTVYEYNNLLNIKIINSTFYTK